MSTKKKKKKKKKKPNKGWFQRELPGAPAWDIE